MNVFDEAGRRALKECLWCGSNKVYVSYSESSAFIEEEGYNKLLKRESSREITCQDCQALYSVDFEGNEGNEICKKIERLRRGKNG